MSLDGMKPQSGKQPDGDNANEVALTMLHLRKLFDEFISVKDTLTDQERDKRLYQMLPLYCNAGNNLKVINDKNKRPSFATPQAMVWESHAAFCHQISQLLAREIKRRALNRSTETASKTIASFLELHNADGNEETGNGSVLLATVCLMATQNNDGSLHEIMINASLPSTLVRCIYLFLDLPEKNETFHCSENPALPDTQTLSFNSFSQILLKLCTNPLAAEELIRADDLTLLFSTVTAQYGPCNRRWRSLAGDVLDTLGRYALSETITTYVHAKGCMALCIDNMQRSISSKPLDTVDMLCSICGFLQQSSQYSQTLMDDFKQCQGYLFLIGCLLKMNQDIQAHEGSDVALLYEKMFLKLIQTIVTLCYCGYAQAPPLHMMDKSKVQFQLQEFRVPPKSSKAACIRNIHAFQVLQTVFLRSTNTSVCCMILDAIKDVYKSDDVNYFMLESQSTFCLFADKIHHKPKTVQQHFFDLIEFIVFQLNFIPRKELIALSVLLKTNQAIETSIACTRTFLRLLRHNNIFIDVYREVGVLEVFVTCMKRYKDYLEENIDIQTLPCYSDTDTMEGKTTDSTTATDSQEILGTLIMEALVRLLNGNSNNTSIFKNSGGNKCIYDILKYKFGSAAVMKIVKELVSTVGGEDDMLHLLKSINVSTEQQSLSALMRIHVLQVLIDCLKESHRTRSIFRKVGGFVYVVNVLDLLKNQFGHTLSHEGPSKIHVRLFRMVCQTLSAAMRFEPANAKYFQNEVANNLFLEAICDMGCFSRNKSLKPYSSDCNDKHSDNCSRQDSVTVDSSLVDAYATVFKTALNNIDNRIQSNELSIDSDNRITPSLRSICIIYRILYDIVLDGFDGPQMVEMSRHSKIITDVGSESNMGGMLGNPSASANINDHVIVHPSVIVCMLKLLPSIEELCSSDDENETLEWDGLSQRAIGLQFFLADVIKSFVRSERNQQIMCDGGLNECIVHFCKEALVDEFHPLHMSLQYIFERLAVQALMSKELRTFLRLGLKLANESEDDPRDNFTPPVPLTRVKTLVSITTPRDFRTHGSYTMPPFIEMDMSTEGFACLFFPNIAPSNLNSQFQSMAHHHLHSSASTGLTGGASGSGITGSIGLSVSSLPGFQSNVSRNANASGLQTESSAGGGIGTGDRTFPSNNGLTFSTWFCVERYPHAIQADGHPIRLLHIVRSDDGSSEDDAVVVFSILILPSDKSLSVATQEFPFSQEYCNVYKDEFLTRVWCPTFIRECQWHHVAVTLGKISPKSSLLSIYLDGRHVHSQKINPISCISASSARNQASCFHAFIGTPPIWRMYSKLVWKQGVCNLIDDSFDASAVARIYMLGPHYLGSFQDVRLEDNEEMSPLVAEDRVVFGINPKAFSYMTLHKIRKVYNRTDAKVIGKQLGMSSHENATPIVVLHNAAGHLNGPARTLGGVLVGYLGIRKFNPFPVSMTINTVGGCGVLLGLVAMSHNIESLYASVKALTCILRTSKLARQEMNQRRFYQTLGMLYKRKKMLLNSHILHLTFNLVGTVHSGHETSTIPNITAFQDMLCDFPIWLDQSNDLIRSLLEHLLELATESNEKIVNIRVMQDLQCLSKLLHITDDICEEGAEKALFALVQILLSHQIRSNDLLLFGQYIAKCIPTMAGFAKHEPENPSDRHVHFRNRCLSILHHLCFGANNVINWRFCDELSRVLGLEWVLLLMQPHLHYSTMIWALRLLVVMLTREPVLARFREGKTTIGEEGYLKNTEIIMQSRNAILLSTKIPTQVSSGSASSAVLEDSLNHQQPLHLMGFPYLEWLLMHRINVPEVFSLLIALIIGYPVKSSIMPSKDKNLESIWSFLWTSAASHNHAAANSASDKMTFCTEAVCILLSLIRSIVHSKETEGSLDSEKDVSPHWLQTHPCEVLRLLMSFHRQLPDFASIVMSADVIVSLIAIQFAPSNAIGIDSDITALGLSPTASPASTKSSSSPSHKDLSPGTTIPGEEATLANLPKASQFRDMSSNEPVIEHVMDFLHTLIIDSLSLLHSGKTPPVIDTVLEFFIPFSNISDDQRKQFLSNIILLLMKSEALLNTLVEGQASTAMGSNHHKLAGQEHVAANVFYLTARFVDKLWQQMLFIDGREMFEYCVQLIHQTKRLAGRTTSSASGAGISGNGSNVASTSSLESLYRSLNRCILYLLAYPPIPADATLVEVLQKLMKNRLLVFGAGNQDPDFIGCLTYCLLQLHHGNSIVLTPPAHFEQERTTTWHVDALVCSDSEDSLASQKLQRYDLAIGASSELANISFRVWEELYVCKKPVIEEIFKVTLTQPLRNTRAPNIDRTYEQIFESAFKHWLAYVETEKRSASRNPWDVHNSIQSKIQKVTGGLTRLTSRTKLKKEVSKRHGQRVEEFNVDLIRQSVSAKLNLVQDFWHLRTTQHSNSYMHTKRYVYQDWLQVEAELIRERAIWGPECCADFTKWTLDSTEGPYRMRKKMLKNVLFYAHYPPRPELDDLNDATDHHHQRQIKSRVAISYDSAKYTKFVRQYRHMFPEQFEQDVAAGSSSSRNDASTNKSEYSNSNRSRNIRQCSKIFYEDIREIHKRRYLLQPIALEVFCGNGQNYLLSFPQKVRNKVFQKVTSMATQIADNAQQSVAGQKRAASVEQNAGLLSSLIGETSVTQRWVRGEISNFQYLMHLNSLAGRSYNDLMQYPVFPWILANYDTETLDLNEPSNFRDLSKPMGAQSQERLEQFLKRYKDWDDPQGDTPPYHYGTHYSSAMIICSYLVRLEPFTQHFLRLQGGHFDLADRMFHSIKEAWFSASKQNMADVKELIPEFFYLPEFLENSNRFDLGTKQNGEILNNVVLPPWAKNDPREFIRMHREALECDYVSRHLHLWIDLIFGYKQQGQAAIDAVNVFHHLFYEGNVDIYNIEDPLQKSAAIGFINNFGQIPKQLFRKQHPAKRMIPAKQFSILVDN
uniref:WD repeat and FYVE domain-containing protein 3 n=1 Tax=Anopheles farauti TaxID=69004 RepID=A0A182QR41_9DIPT